MLRWLPRLPPLRCGPRRRFDWLAWKTVWIIFQRSSLGGEQQRVAIARAVAKQPVLLLCDEPTGALDFPTGKLVLEVIDEVNRQLGTTTAIITHNASIARMADRVVTLRSGEIVDIQHNLVRAAPSELEW